MFCYLVNHIYFQVIDMEESLAGELYSAVLSTTTSTGSFSL